ncbi:MAG: HRDC domain-containing protein [Gemmataceae bacterium]
MTRPNELVVTTLDALDDCCARLAHSKVFGFDTEFVGETSYHPELCLIQVATDDTLYLIDPFAFESLDAFWNVVVHPDHLVVVHAGREEIRLCHLASGKAPGNVFDLQIAAGLIGLTYPISHGNLVEALLGKRLSKGETLTEWRHRPLTGEQIGYAFDDVRHLLPLYRKLHKRLEELGRLDWAGEEFARLREQSQVDEAGLAPTGEKWRKLKGSGTLDRRRLAVLRAIFQWREELAHKANRPPRSLLRDDLLVEIARRNPRSAKDLHVVRGLAKKHADALMPVIEAARALPADEMPAPYDREADPPQVALLSSVLGLVLADWCARRHVAPALAASAGDLKALVKGRLRQTAPTPESPLARGWRAQEVTPALEVFLDGKTSLRVRDAVSPAPFVVE